MSKESVRQRTVPCLTGLISGPGSGGSYALKDSARLMNKNISYGLKNNIRNSVRGAVKLYLSRKPVKEFYSGLFRGSFKDFFVDVTSNLVEQ